MLESAIINHRSCNQEICYFNLLSPGECNNSFESSARTPRLAENFLSIIKIYCEHLLPRGSISDTWKLIITTFQSSFQMFGKFRKGSLVQFFLLSAKMTYFTFTLQCLSNSFTELVGPKWEEEISSSALPKSETFEKGVFFAVRLSIQA